MRQHLAVRHVGKLLEGADLVVDGLGNHDPRALVTEHGRERAKSCLHVGLSADYAEVLWNEGYRVPGDVAGAGADVCDYPLARNLIQFPLALTNEAMDRFALQGQK